jgi:peptidoglycan/xylan/chitin deacetylase (PgdA/CDA1 family)
MRNGCLVNPDASQSQVARAPDAGGAPALSGDVVILMYHHCAKLPPDAIMRGLYVSPRQFAWQMDWLSQRNLQFCGFGDLEKPVPAGKTRVMITFDDGLRDVYENAWPILAERRLPAVIFPVVGDIGKSGVVWTENKDKSPQALMTENQIREMTDGGIEFGSHLWEHRKASRLPAAELREQLARSRDRLSQITGRDTPSIAYPYGDYSPDVVAETARAGYRYAVTTKEGANRGTSLLELRRYAAKGARFYHPLRFIRTMRRALAAAANGTASG